MQFKILSHAGLQVTTETSELVCDPWLLGSCYWRSWWNYPPVNESLISNLSPSAIYLTHVHWDHFHGPSLRRFDETTLILVPAGNYGRIRKDLLDMGYSNVVELTHGQTYRIDDSIEITSFQFGPFLDSAAVITADGKTLFNANDAKIMGLPLRQILRQFPNIDFVLRSHSSANARLCFEYTDGSEEAVDDIESYIESFAQFCKATGATYAIPFASNHCFLHKEVFHYNETIQTPSMVEKFWKTNGIESPDLRVMLSGDTWENEAGFKIATTDYFDNRPARLVEYRDAMAPKLESSYRQEERAKIRLPKAQEFFHSFSRSIPKFLKTLLIKDTVFLYVLRSGDQQYAFEFDINTGKFSPQSIESINEYDAQIHTATRIFNQCVTTELFSHLAISKRVKYKVTRKTKSRVAWLNLFFNMYEYELLPLRRNFTKRSIVNWALRWRELVLYFQLTFNLVTKGTLQTQKYLRAQNTQRT